MHWETSTIDEVKQIIRRDLTKCTASQIEAFHRFAIEPYSAKLLRYGNVETAIIIARKGDDAMYWEDVEEGFNISGLSSDGMILEHGCNQDELHTALQRWL